MFYCWIINLCDLHGWKFFLPEEGGDRWVCQAMQLEGDRWVRFIDQYTRYFDAFPMEK